MNNAIVLAGTFTTGGAQSKLIRDQTGNIAAADTPRFAAASLVNFYGDEVLNIGELRTTTVIYFFVLS